MSKKPEASPASLKFIRLLLLVAIGLSGYLATQALTGATVAGCGEEQGCGKVLASKWASILKIPVSIPGLLIYISLLGISFQKPLNKKPLGYLATFLSVAIITGALWFTLLQVLIIKEYCPYCCATHAIASLAAILTLGALKTKGTQSDRIRVKGITLASFLAILSVGGAILLQAFGPQKDHSQVISVTDKATSTTATSENKKLISVYRANTTQRPRLTLVGGQYNAPNSIFQSLTIGAPSEENKSTSPTHLVYLFDWTCDYCRKFHKKLEELSVDSSSLGLDSQYQIALLPASNGKEGDSLHQIMLSAYFGDRVTYKALVSALYDGTLNAEPNAVRDRAIELLGKPKWQKLIQRSNYRANQAKLTSELQIAHNEQFTKASTFPQLVSTSSLIMGLPSDERLKEFLADAKLKQEEVLASPDFGTLRPITYQKGKTPKPKEALPVRNKSKIEFVESSITAEPILAGEKATGTFKFKNTGTEPLEIYNLKTGCGCTYSKGWKQIVPPGESGEFTITYNSRGKSPYGTHTRNVWVTSSAENFDKSSSMGARYGNQVKLLVPLKNKDGSPAIRPTTTQVKKVVPVRGPKPEAKAPTKVPAAQAPTQ